MKILLVEDETHKREEMKQCSLDAYGVMPDIVDSVSSAVLTVMENDFDLSFEEKIIVPHDLGIRW